MNHRKKLTNAKLGKVVFAKKAIAFCERRIRRGTWLSFYYRSLKLLCLWELIGDSQLELLN